MIITALILRTEVLVRKTLIRLCLRLLVRHLRSFERLSNLLLGLLTFCSVGRGNALVRHPDWLIPQIKIGLRQLKRFIQGLVHRLLGRCWLPLLESHHVVVQGVFLEILTLLNLLLLLLVVVEHIQIWVDQLLLLEPKPALVTRLDLVQLLGYVGEGSLRPCISDGFFL